jgi:hypothetical protein
MRGEQKKLQIKICEFYTQQIDCASPIVAWDIVAPLSLISTSFCLSFLHLRLSPTSPHLHFPPHVHLPRHLHLLHLPLYRSEQNRGSALNSLTCIACQGKRKPPINFAELGRKREYVFTRKLPFQKAIECQSPPANTATQHIFFSPFSLSPLFSLQTSIKTFTTLCSEFKFISVLQRHTNKLVKVIRRKR